MRFYTKQHQFYCGIDLHTQKMYICILDAGGEIPLQQIRRYGKMMLAIGRHPVFAADLGTKARMTHPLGHTVFTDPAAPILKLLGDLGAAIAP
ncbi:MAG: hypothetical protein R6W88_05325, partial [Desulfobacterales bacterium]